MALSTLVFFVFIISGRLIAGELTLDYYSETCPTVFEVVRKEMGCAVLSDPRNAAKVIRLHFHDCFVQGCDGSILLDDTLMLKGEISATPNANSLKGFEIIDSIKNKVESDCPGVVSCADILALAARDATVLVGGPDWEMYLGRKDSRTASYELADSNLPLPTDGLLSIISKFIYQGLSVTDMVALSGSHTIGMARCDSYRERIHGDYEVTSDQSPTSESHLKDLKATCPAAGGEDDTVSPMDYESPNLFDNSFFRILLRGEGLLNSDQELYSSILGLQTKQLVIQYAHDSIGFFHQFAESMVRMGNITNEVDAGEVRRNCRFVNI
ncbi:Peroxidase 11 [Linum grandiflorum]